MSFDEREQCIGAIADAEHRRKVEEKILHPYIIEQDKKNLWERATGYAAERLLTGYPESHEIEKDAERARKDIKKQYDNNNWFYGVHIVSRAEITGQATAMVADNFVIPQLHRDNVICITDGRREEDVERPEENRRAVLAHAAGF